MSTHDILQAPRGAMLAVDDEPDILIALEDLFEDQFEVLTASSPAKGLDILRARPDVLVIVSDERMPGMMGHAFLRAAREVSDAQALLLTGYADLPAVVAALNDGRISGYMRKPWDSDALRAMVLGAARRRRLELELDLERALLRGLLAQSADAISFKDAQGRFLRLNHAKAALLGRDVEACMGRREVDLVEPSAAQVVAAAERQAIDTGETFEAVEEFSTDDGARWRLASRTPIPGADGGVEALVTIERDITEQRRAEARLRQAEKMQALGTLAGGVAHDFNNLLTAVLGGIELASRRVKDDARVSQLLANAASAARRGAGLTHRLLNFSRQRDLEPQVVDVNAVLGQMSDLLSRTLGGLVTVEWRCEDDLWPVFIDPAQLELAVLNLCINARDAMPEGGVVTISAGNVVAASDAQAAPDDYVLITVADTGEGIPPDVAARIFEPFFTTKDVGKGTGLGLSMVYGLVQQSGGWIDLDTAPSLGTTMKLYLPRSVAQVDAPPVAEPQARPVCSGSVLLVDDDAAVRTVTAQFLEELGLRVIEAGSAAESLTTLEKGARVDLLLADVAMPDMSGVELAAIARRRAPDLPILLITGNPNMSAGADFAVLHKPFRIEELGQAVRATIAGPRTAT